MALILIFLYKLIQQLNRAFHASIDPKQCQVAHSMWKQGYYGQGSGSGVQDGDRGDIYKSKCDNGSLAAGRPQHSTAQKSLHKSANGNGKQQTANGKQRTANGELPATSFQLLASQLGKQIQMYLWLRSSCFSPPLKRFAHISLQTIWHLNLNINLQQTDDGEEEERRTELTR